VPDVYSADDTDTTAGGELPATTEPTDTAENAQQQQSEADKALVKKILKTIKLDKKHHAKAFKRMQDSMFMAMHGRAMEWSAKNYKANIVGRHINQKTASIYAKNPKIVARRKEMLDFELWDESPETLQIAMQTMQSAAQAQAAPVPVDPTTGAPAPLAPEQAMALQAQQQAAEQASALLADIQQGMMRRQLVKKFGKTLELVFADSMRQQTPLDFKTAMKQLVRRTATNAAGYVELGFKREFGVPQATNDVLEDYETQLEHLQGLLQEASEGEIGECEADIAELEAMIAAEEAKPQQVKRVGLTFDFHQSTKVIPDRMTKNLVGFVGSRHLTIEIPYLKKDAEDHFKVELGAEYTPFNIDGQRTAETAGIDFGDQEPTGFFAVDRSENDYVTVYKHYDKRSGLMYVVCEGHSKFLRAPSAPDVIVPRFWPVYPITFNPVEHEGEIFPLSDVELLRDQQEEINRSRQGKREHRKAARPRWVYANGALDEGDIDLIMAMGPMEAAGINLGAQTKVADVLQAMPVPGVDPNLYDTNEVLQDASMTVGANASQLGGQQKSTATQAAIADGAMANNDASAVDDLDAFLTVLARDGGQILQMNLSKEEVQKIAGRGAVWVEDLGMTPEDIANEVYLEVEAGSSGKPNQPQEIRNFKDMFPLLSQVPGVGPLWLAREGVRRLDDRIDLTEAVVAGIPSIVAMNSMKQGPSPDGDPQKDPNAQGDKGGNNGPPPAPESAGTGPAFGSNQI